ncbi:hypothetical protein C8J57DRAFT_598712, partial [Mycena rebaudengoi]
VRNRRVQNPGRQRREEIPGSIIARCCRAVRRKSSQEPSSGVCSQLLRKCLCRRLIAKEVGCQIRKTGTVWWWQHGDYLSLLLSPIIAVLLLPMTPTVPPSFPLDLEREIFEMSAVEHPEMMPALILVAHRVLQWIEPLLYRTLLLTRNFPRDKSALLLAAQRTPAKFTKYVQNLLLWPYQNLPMGPQECAMILMSLCSGISRLVLFDPIPEMLPALDNMRVDHLSVSLAYLFGHPSDIREIDPGRPLFQAVTHLQISDGMRWVVGMPFAELPALTHLCVSDLQPLLSILKNCEKLHVLVHMYSFRVEFKQDFVDDPRLVLMTLSPQEYITDWVAGAKGEQDFWARAEMFVAKRKRGEIEPVFRCWIMEEDLID